MATAKERRENLRAATQSFDPDAAVAAKRRDRPLTAPGLLMHDAEIIDGLRADNSRLKSQLEAWEGDGHSRMIDPGLIDESAWANRHASSYESSEFAELKAEIAAAGGNVQPVKVRAKPDGRFELVFGHRRTRACKELGLPVLAVIVDQMDEVSLFVEMDRENRQRQDLSAWEQGVMYNRALEAGLFPSQRKLAEALGVDLSNAGKCLALARLPVEVIRAFKTPLEIQLRWGGKLAKAYEADPDRMKAEARKLEGLSPRPKANVVFNRLTAANGGGSEPPPQQSAKVAVKKDGSAVIKLPPGAVGDADLVDLQRLIEDFVSRKNR